MTYKPKPINTSNILLTDEIKALSELLAKNTHEIWASQRISEGWTYGPRRDDLKKKHPDLVSYEDLPELEREYDNKIAEEAIKVIIAKGYKIEKIK